MSDPKFKTGDKVDIRGAKGEILRLVERSGKHLESEPNVYEVLVTYLPDSYDNDVPYTFGFPEHDIQIDE